MNLNIIAKLLDDAVLNSTAVEQISHSRKLTIDEAYAVQSILISRRYQRGEQLSGLKLGFTSKAKMEQMGVEDMIWGRLTDQMYIENESSIEKSKFIHPRAEAEIAFRIGKKVDKVLTHDNVMDYIDGIAVAIEIIDSRYKNFKFSLEDVIADNCSSAAYCIGNWHTTATTVRDLKMSLKIDGKVVHEGNSNDILGDPIESMIAVSRLSLAYGECLIPGDVVLAGAATPAVFVEKLQTVEAEAFGLGHARLVVM